MHRDDILLMQREARRVTIQDNVARYIVDIIEQTRREPRLRLGASPRGSLMLFRGAQAAASIDGRDYVTPDDIQFLAPHILSHRLIRNPKDKYAGTPTTEIVTEIIKKIKVPV
jgi:MoxR-like ATPase